MQGTMRRTRRLRPGFVALMLACLLCFCTGFGLTLSVLARTAPEAQAPAKVLQDEPPANKDTAEAEELPWNLLLVNPENPLPENFSVSLTTLTNGLQADSRAYPALQEMLDAMRAEGLSPVVCSAFRSGSQQQELYDAKIDTLRQEGYSTSEAAEEAARWVAVPGTSEHQTGLAIDIVAESYQHLDSAQADTAEQQWLLEHCWDYGFILRYPEEKELITGISYEPWHYRYVGEEAAQAMQQSGQCLEEFLAPS